MLHQTFLFLGQLWQLFGVSQILEFLLYLTLYQISREHFGGHSKINSLNSPYQDAETIQLKDEILSTLQ